MNILSIGNSFSQDAQRYLHRIAKADGVVLNTFNLHIGGCSRSLHYRNMLSEKDAYFLEMNGNGTGFRVSLKEALLNRDWDVITIRQVSGKSPCYETYQPYLNKIVDYIRMYVPKAKVAIHQTWAYEQDSQRLNDVGYSDQADMFRDIEKSYKKAAEDCGAGFIIPSGELFQKLIKAEIGPLHRDTYHVCLGVGRYALGLLWYKVLTKNSVVDNTFCEFDEPILQEKQEIIKKCVESM